jgi:outer membrane protein OmpA-like peptidoglycan-associated protein
MHAEGVLYMEKRVVLSITMLLSLAGCGGGHKQKQVTKQVDVFSSSEIPLVVDIEEEDEATDGEVVSFFDEFDEFDDADAAVDTLVVREAFDAADAQEVESSIITWSEIEQEEEFQKIYFDFAKHNIKQNQQKNVKANTTKLKEVLASVDEDTIILVEGHTDHAAGSTTYNHWLGEQRAKEVFDHLVSQGINPDRIRVVTRGQECPAIVNGSPVTGSIDQQWPNRRVEIHLVDVA